MKYYRQVRINETELHDMLIEKAGTPKGIKAVVEIEESHYKGYYTAKLTWEIKDD